MSHQPTVARVRTPSRHSLYCITPANRDKQRPLGIVRNPRPPLLRSRQRRAAVAHRRASVLRAPRTIEEQPLHCYRPAGYSGCGCWTQRIPEAQACPVPTGRDERRRIRSRKHARGRAGSSPGSPRKMVTQTWQSSRVHRALRPDERRKPGWPRQGRPERYGKCAHRLGRGPRD